MKLYEVRDYITRDERLRLGLGIMDSHYLNIRAVHTGEFRPPKQGEWYLSGAIVEAYRAPNDLDTAYHIAKLVRIKTETITRIVEF